MYKNRQKLATCTLSVYALYYTLLSHHDLKWHWETTAGRGIECADMAYRHFVGQLETIPPLLYDDCHTQKRFCCHQTCFLDSKYHTRAFVPGALPQTRWGSLQHPKPSGSGRTKREEEGRGGEQNRSMPVLLYPHFHHWEKQNDSTCKYVSADDFIDKCHLQ